MKPRNLLYISLMILILSLTIPSGAGAIPFPVSVPEVDPGTAVKVKNGRKTSLVMAGIYNLEVGAENEAYDSFCIDFRQSAPRKDSNYVYRDLDELFSPEETMDLTKLWGNYYSDSMSDYLAASLQLAIWEVTEEKKKNVYDLTSGKFRLLGGLNNELAQSMLGSLPELVIPENLSLVALYSKKKQDYLVSAPVPEPATMLLLGTGLAGTMVVRRRRRKKK